MPNLVVYQPPENLVVQPNQPFLVTGQASDQGMPEPHMIDSVTVQVDAGHLIEATLTNIPDKKITLFAFKASAQVTGGQGPHTVTVTATNDTGVSVTKTVVVFTGPIFEVDSPAVLVDIISPFPIDPSDPKIVSLMSQIQQQLTPLSVFLASVGKMLAGPNLVVATNPLGVPVLRMGLWIEDSTFPVVAPAPPKFPLPRLSDQAASAGFATAPLLLVPDLSLPDPPSLPGPAFALSILVTTLQHLLDAVAPALKTAASQQDVSLESITVQTNSPGSVNTSFIGHLPLDVPFSVNITETLGRQPLPDAQPPQSVPAVIGNSHSASVGSIFDWLVGLIFPLFDLALLAASGFASSGAGQIAGQINGIAAPLIAGIPSRIPFRNTMLPSSPLLSPPDFPTLVPDWRSFGVTSSGILGTGTTSIEARDQTMVALTINGSHYIRGYQEDLAGGAGQTYNFTLVNLAPDPDKFNWQVSGTGSNGGSIDLDPFNQAGSFPAYFPLPLKVKPGNSPFTLAVNAIETCGSDPSKTLSASNSMGVRVEVIENPEVPL